MLQTHFSFLLSIRQTTIYINHPTQFSLFSFPLTKTHGLTNTNNPNFQLPIFPKCLLPIKAKATSSAQPPYPPPQHPPLRRHFLSLVATTTTTLSLAGLLPVTPASAASDEEYVNESKEVINKVRRAINMDKNVRPQRCFCCG